MFITCWSSKGGSGTTVVAAVLAAVLAAEVGPTLLVDLGGDLPAALGRPEPALGLTSWGRRPNPSSPADRHLRDGLRRLVVDGGPGVGLLPRGAGRLEEGIGPALAEELSGRGPVVVDGGTAAGSAADAGPVVDLAAAAGASLLVLRPCFLALRRAVTAPVRRSGVVMVDEPHRSLGRSDIEAALGVPVVAVVPWDPAVARRVDSGLLASAPPRAMARALRGIVSGARDAQAS